jgi:hypothetical protein
MNINRLPIFNVFTESKAKYVTANFDLEACDNIIRKKRSTKLLGHGNEYRYTCR